jgi:hypothetical protein
MKKYKEQKKINKARKKMLRAVIEDDVGDVVGLLRGQIQGVLGEGFFLDVEVHGFDVSRDVVQAGPTEVCIEGYLNRIEYEI